MLHSSPRSRRAGFTLVELLVVIGIIALLISILLPALNSARKQADRVKCLAALQQIGVGYNMYSTENNGYWPMALFFYQSSTGAGREKRWHDFISKYTNNGKILNDSGTQVGTPTNNPQIQHIKDDNNILWGCPSWKRVTRSGTTLHVEKADANAHPGYAMNIYTFAPRPTNQYINGYMPWAYRKPASFPDAKNAGGWFWKQSQWKRPGERALIAESVHGNLSVTANWPWWSGPKMPDTPDVSGAVSMPLDFNRHGKLPVGNGPDVASLNMLFCDGHAAFLSLKEAHYAIRFTGASAPTGG
jgi:prepilin-type N-terminal cleavage/methylation domain-containing protein/prepilin-type processing-associated H-X9-DG protein